MFLFVFFKEDLYGFCCLELLALLVQILTVDENIGFSTYALNCEVMSSTSPGPLRKELRKLTLGRRTCNIALDFCHSHTQINACYVKYFTQPSLVCPYSDRH